MIYLYLFAFFLLLKFIGFPLVFLLFQKTEDRGFAFAGFFALLCISYVSFLMTSIGFFPFNQTTILVVTFFFTLLSFALFIIKRQEIQLYIQKNFKILFFEAIIFFLCFSAFLAIRFGNPDLWHTSMGGEKPMDIALLNALARTTVIPPLDPWFAGESVNYYYFGQLILSIPIKITGISTTIFYNIALAFLFAQTAISMFSLINNTTKSKLFGIFGAIFLVSMGNLYQIKLIINSFHQQIPINAWYWTATRIMPNSEINEFPFFTFLYADLHAHLIALPIALFVLAFSLSFLEEKNKSTFFIVKLIIMSLALGILRATNVWDYPTYFGASILILCFANITHRITIKHAFLKTIASLFSIGIISNIAMIPFLRHYKIAPLNVIFYHGPHTALMDYGIIHGFFLFIIGSLFLFALYRRKIVLDKLFQISVLFTLLAIIATLIPDIIDIPLGLGRMNTVFKFYFQAWVFYSIASVYALSLLFHMRKDIPFIPKTCWAMLFLLLFFISFSYVPTATSAKIHDRISTSTPRTLDGALFMQYASYFDQDKLIPFNQDFAAIAWINSNIKETPVLVEAQTPAYRWGGRISAYTGIQTIIGWDWHEKAHRSYLLADDIDKRVADVKLFYETRSSQEALSVIKRYNVSYIYVGELEKAYYSFDGLEKFSRLINEGVIDIIYKNGNTIIYKVIHG